MKRLILCVLLVFIFAAPSWAAIAFKSAASAASNSVTLGTHASGDLIVIMAVDPGLLGTPSAPGGWTVIDTKIVNGGSISGILAYKIAASSSEVSGTWTNAGYIEALVYSGINSGSPIGGLTFSSPGNGGIIDYGTVTMADSSGASWVVGVAGHNSANNANTAPTGMTNRTSAGTGPMIAAHDTGAGVSSWSIQSVTMNGSNWWLSWTIEIKASGGGPDVTPFYRRRIQ